MGIFSSSTKIIVSSAAMHLLDVNNLSNPVGDAVAEAVLTSGVPFATMQDITGNLLASNLQGLSIKVDRAYDYALDHYTLGLPSGDRMALPLIDGATIKPYILAETAYPYDILVTNYEYATFTPMLAIAAFLRNVREYDTEAHSIGTWPAGVTFTSCYGEDPAEYAQRLDLDSVTIMEDGVTALVTYRKFIDRPVVTYNGGFVPTITISSVDDGTVTEEVAIPFASPADLCGKECLFTLYQEVDEFAQLQPTYKTWVYFLDTYLYPELHPDIEQELSTYMPVVPIRYRNVDLTVPNETELYTTSKELLKLMGLNIESLGIQLNKNPGIDDIDHAYVMFGVNLQTEHIPSLYYLNHFFYLLAQSQRGTEASFLAALDDPYLNDEPVNAYSSNSVARLNRHASDALKEYGLALDFQYDYIKDWVTDAVLGEVGYTDKAIVAYTANARYSTPVVGGFTIYSKSYTRGKLVLRTQINAYQYRTVEVYNLVAINWVYGSHTVKTSLLDVKRDTDENNLIIPVQYQVSREVFTRLRDRDSFYADTLMLLINSYEKVKIKWYQKGFFKFLMIIISVTIAIWTGQAWLVKLSAAAEAGIVATLVFLRLSVWFFLALSYAVKFVVKNFGEKLGIFGSLLLAIAAVAVSKGFGTMGTVSEYAMTSAQYMLQISSSLVSSANEFLLEKATQIYEEFADFSEKMSGLWEELEEMLDLLEQKADVDPLTFTKPEKLRILPNESPTVFFNRCLGLADNSVFSIHDEIPNFFDMRLRHKKEVSADVFNLYSYS